jgi:hypothetical protein
VLLGAVLFVVGCFAPYVSFESRDVSPSLYEMQTMRHSGLGWVGAIVILFTGVTALIGLATLAITRRRSWIRLALVCVAAVWALEEIGFALGASGLWPSKAAGYWMVLAAIAIVVGGSLIVGAELLRERIPERPDGS